MQETHCLRCGFVFFADPTQTLCPHCGRNFHTPLRRAWSVGSPFIWLSGCYLLTIWPIFRDERTSATDWESVLVTGVLLAVALAFLFYMRKQSSSQQTFTALNPRVKEVYDAASKLAPVSPARPETPAQLQPLISLSRPRTIYFPLRAKVGVTVFAIFYVGAVATAWKRYMPPTGRHIALTYNLFGFVFLALGLRAAIGLLHREFSAQTLLRDGEVTIGYVIDAVRRVGGGANVSYQFWTRLGERFEHQGPLVSRESIYSNKELVPVFYMPENPAKSVALCCVRSRVRVREGKELLQPKSSPVRH